VCYVYLFILYGVLKYKNIYDGEPKKKIIVETHETHFQDEAITLLVVVPMGRCL
jgi:hypothetical protein